MNRVNVATRRVDASLSIVGLMLLTCCTGLAGAAERAHTHGGSSTATVGQTPFGIAGSARNVSRTVVVDMSDDMRFTPAAIEVTAGETIRFRTNNRGRLVHEMVIGRMSDLREHASAMRKSPTMQHHEANAAHVQPGGSRNVVWKFNRPGEFSYACLIDGHFEAGMVGTIIVKPQQ